jgi:hypothetical protein
VRIARRLAAVLAFLACAACLPSSVVAPEDRAAFLVADELPWRPHPGTPLAGLYASVSITGDLSLGLLKVYYHFLPDGRFTGAALLAGDPPAFQVLSGAWSLDEQGLRLGDGPPATLEEAPGHLRLTGAEGAVVLRLENP